MSLPSIVSREEWTRVRVALLEREKALTKARDGLAAERRRLPMVEVTEDYRFTAADGGTRTLADLFEGRHQLIVDHYMFDPDWEDGCMSCAGRVDQYGNIEHLHERDTTIAVVSRAPIEKIERWRRKMGWAFRGTPASAAGSTTTTASPSTGPSKAARTTTAPPPSGRRGGCPHRRASCTARACSCASASASFTPTRHMAAAPSRSGGRTTTST